MTIPPSKSLSRPHRSVLLDQLMSAVEVMPEMDRKVFAALIQLTLLRATANHQEDPFAAPVPVTAEDLKQVLPDMGLAQVSALLEKMRQVPILLQKQGSCLGTADGRGLPVLDIIRTQMHNTAKVRFAWWVRMGLWSHWRLTDAERYFIARALAVWLRAPTHEISSLVKFIVVKMAEGSSDLCRPFVARPVLRDLVVGCPQIPKHSDAWLATVHHLEEAGLLICPADWKPTESLEKLLDVRTDSTAKLSESPATRH